MQLHEFQPNVGGTEAYSIKAKQLDDNFAMLQPKSNGTYGLDEKADGWTLNIFPAFPQKVEKPVALVYNGSKAGTESAPINTSQVGLQWVTIAAGYFNTGSVTANAHFVANGGGGAFWTYPPYGEPAWREVERCDGKKMWVWATEWADPVV